MIYTNFVLGDVIHIYVCRLTNSINYQAGSRCVSLISPRMNGFGIVRCHFTKLLQRRDYLAQECLQLGYLVEGGESNDDCASSRVYVLGYLFRDSFRRAVGPPFVTPEIHAVVMV